MGFESGKKQPEAKQVEERGEVANKKSTSKEAAIGAMVLAAALGSAPEDASAQTQRTPETNATTQQVESERRIFRQGTATHPELGALTIQVYYKSIDMNAKDVTLGSPYGVRINGVEQKVTASRFMRNGAGVVELLSNDGKIEKLIYPSSTDAVGGKLPTYVIQGGALTLTMDK